MTPTAVPPGGTSAGRVAPSPVSPARLAGLVADLAQAGTGSRVGVEGPVARDAAALADAVTAALAGRAVPVARVRAEDFLRARSLRLEHGDADPDAFLEGWYDLPALRREVLDPMRPDPPAGTHRQWLPGLRDPVTDRPYRHPRRTAAPSAVLVLDGRFLARRELAGALDVLVHLEVSPAAQARRVPAAEQARVLPAWRRYRERYRPERSADLVVRYDRPTHPAVLRAVTPST